DEIRDLRRQAAGNRAGELAAGAVDGVVVARVDGLAPNEVRDLAVAVREQPGIRGAVIGSAREDGGVALLAAVTKDSGLHAGELITEAKGTIGGGGGGKQELAQAGGSDASRLDEALDQVRAAAGLA
ncbi:MAG TPA: DHHA1 domain-containing protein, partial [Acidimicrobiales bacterium]